MAATFDPIGPWADFYLIIGGGSAALTGLMFVVITLSAESRTATHETHKAFGTPTVIHYSVAFLLSAVLTVPGHTARSLAVSYGVMGVAGLVYLAVVVMRMRRQHDYEPVVEDWLWHVALPVVAYLALAIAAVETLCNIPRALYIVAASAVLLLAAGIHNAWDAATYIAQRSRRDASSATTPE